MRTHRKRRGSRRTFWREEEGILSDYDDSMHVSELGCSLAILAGVLTKEQEKALAEKLAAYRKEASDKVLAKDQKISEQYSTK